MQDVSVEVALRAQRNGRREISGAAPLGAARLDVLDRVGYPDEEPVPAGHSRPPDITPGGPQRHCEGFTGAVPRRVIGKEFYDLVYAFSTSSFRSSTCAIQRRPGKISAVFQVRAASSQELLDEYFVGLLKATVAVYWGTWGFRVSDLSAISRRSSSLHRVRRTISGTVRRRSPTRLSRHSSRTAARCGSTAAPRKSRSIKAP